VRSYEIFDADYFARKNSDDLFSDQYLQCIVHFNKVIAKDGNDSTAVFIRGLAYLKLGYKKEALDDFRSALKMGLEIPDTILLSARGHRYLGERSFRPQKPRVN
jgi:tetratricopeptide (TPR) repeat protein